MAQCAGQMPGRSDLSKKDWRFTLSARRAAVQGLGKKRKPSIATMMTETTGSADEKRTKHAAHDQTPPMASTPTPPEKNSALSVSQRRR